MYADSHELGQLDIPIWTLPITINQRLNNTTEYGAKYKQYITFQHVGMGVYELNLKFTAS